MAYIVFDDQLYASIKAEVDPAVSKGPIGLSARLESCERLMAVYHEVLRLNTASASVRTVAKPTDLRHLTLSTGATVLAPFRQLHFDKTVFGENADTFDPDRFLLNKDLAKSPSFRPFGGGTTYCAGRYVARREVLTFVGLAIHRYDIAMVADQQTRTFQELISRCPVLGYCRQSKGMMYM